MTDQANLCGMGSDRGESTIIKNNAADILLSGNIVSTDLMEEAGREWTPVVVDSTVLNVAFVNNMYLLRQSICTSVNFAY